MRWCRFTVILPLFLPPVCYGDEISFSKHIQPIFAQHCLQCHGPDSERREADLRLDMERSAKQAVIVSGDPDASDLLARITSDDPDLRMPPRENRALSDTQIRLITEWIATGAQYEQHWAFQPIEEVRADL